MIVGSGPAGCVLANRLSEDATKTVLLIETGQPESFMQKVPVATTLSINSKYIRTYNMERTPNTCLSKWTIEFIVDRLLYSLLSSADIIGQSCPYPVGEALGGSSVINYMVYTRGNRDDFDRWQAKGGVQWGYEESMRLYDELESSTAFGKEANPNGTLSVENAPHETELLEYYLAAAEELGVQIIDYNSGDQMGIGVTQGTSLNGRRMSAADAYLFNVFPGRSNLHIVTNSVATRIVIDNSTKTATAVEFVQKGRSVIVGAAREVILSAGPIRSAQLLMVSGIGPRDHLMERNVPFIHELPVGEFYDHVSLQAPTFLVNTTDQSLNLKKVLPSELLQFPAGRGVATMYLGLEALAFHKTNTSERPATCPDLEVVFMSGGVHSDFGTGFRKTARIEQRVYNDFFRPLEDTAIDTWTAIILNLHPRTRGRISLRDNSMLTDPVVAYPFFEDVRDLEDLVEGVRIVMRYAETQAMQMIGTRIYDKKLPGCEGEVFGSDDYWRCYIRRMTTIIVHAVASNRMGQRGDPEAVVDERLRVHGVNRLRVADTSVIPMTVSGHPQAFSYLIGERAARMIKEDAEL